MSGSPVVVASPVATRVRAAAKRSLVSSGVARVPFAAPLPLPKLLLCDLDGTLIDSMPALAELATEVMEEVFAMPGALARELYLATCGLPFVQQLEEIFPGDPRNAAAVATFEGAKPARCAAIEMSGETRGALEELKRAGVRIAVSSNNGIDNVNAFARLARFDFDMLLGYGDGLAKGKPHLEASERAYSVDRQQMLFVGDSLHDGEIAEREGVPFVALATTFSPERFALRFPHVPVLRRFAALPELFQ